MLLVVDLGLSNLESVLQALRRIGTDPVVGRRPEDVAAASVVLLPGVGAFGDGMASLAAGGLGEPIVRHARAGGALAGICLGMQLLSDGSSEHGDHAGLGLLPGRCARLAPEDPGLRVPNIGWCDVRAARDDGPVAADDCFYFAHSYHLVTEDPADVAATIDYGGTVTAAVARGPVSGVQFHPEKSQDAGLAVLERLAAGASPA